MNVGNNRIKTQSDAGKQIAKRQFNRIGKLRELAAKLKPESLFSFGTLSAVRVSRDKRNGENAGNSKIEATLVQIRKMEQGSLKG